MSMFQTISPAVASIPEPASGFAPFPVSPETGLALYASGIDTSDYVQKILPVLRQLAPDVGDLIDVGAGGGQLGGALRAPDGNWTAVEPSRVMQARLAALPVPPVIVPARWEEAGERVGMADTVLAATMPGYFGDARAFLAWCKTRARRRVVWLTPAQAAPRGLVLAACLPREWHREDETPGIDLVLPQLGDAAPHHWPIVDWTFSLVTPELPQLAAWMADRLGWSADDDRRPALFHHLAAQAIATPQGLRLSCSRRSAILIWNI